MNHANQLTGRRMDFELRKKSIIRDLKTRRYIYFMMIPVLIYYIIFSYLPMYGIVIAFQNYSLKANIFANDWVGFKHFVDFFQGPYFVRTVKNTLTLTLMILGIGFPISILFSLLLNEVSHKLSKRVFQTISYLPYFISIVVLAGIIREFTAQHGVITYFFSNVFGYNANMSMLMKPSLFRPIYVVSDIWQFLGWNSIIYLSAISAINPELYEAATIDGASRFKRVIHITLPGITGTIIMLLIFQIGGLMNLPLDKVLLLQNPVTYSTSDVISTLVYRQGLHMARISESAAIGLFNSSINFILLLSANKLTKVLAGTSLF